MGTESETREFRYLKQVFFSSSHIKLLQVRVLYLEATLDPVWEVIRDLIPWQALFVLEPFEQLFILESKWKSGLFDISPLAISGWHSYRRLGKCQKVKDIRSAGSQFEKALIGLRSARWTWLIALGVTYHLSRETTRTCISSVASWNICRRFVRDSWIRIAILWALIVRIQDRRRLRCRFHGLIMGMPEVCSIFPLYFSFLPAGILSDIWESQKQGRLSLLAVVEEAGKVWPRRATPSTIVMINGSLNIVIHNPSQGSTLEDGDIIWED